jgi:hypothetical protein
MTEVFCSCGKRFQAKPEHIGRWAQCPKCGQRFVLSPQLDPQDLIELEPMPFPATQEPPTADNRLWALCQKPAVLLGVTDLILIAVFACIYVIRPSPKTQINAPAKSVAILTQAEKQPTKNPGRFPPLPGDSFRPRPTFHFELEPPPDLGKSASNKKAIDALRDLELEAREFRRQEEQKDVARFKKAMIEENERLRKEWLASGKPEKQGDLAYLTDRIAEVMRIEQEEILDSARKGNQKPDPETPLGKSFLKYADKKSDLYNDVLARMLREIAPGWFRNTE